MREVTGGGMMCPSWNNPTHLPGFSLRVFLAPCRCTLRAHRRHPHSPGVVPSLVHLSLQPAHRRGWGSLYAALQWGRVEAEALRALLGGYPLASEGPPVHAVDVSVWSRCDAESSPERGYYYHPSRHSRQDSPS